MNELWNAYRNPKQGFVSKVSASNWPEGLLIGNGTVGAIVMGHPQKECLIINHEELFLPLFELMPVLEMHRFLPELREMIHAGEYRAASERVVIEARNAGYPEDYLMTNPIHPAFDLIIDFGPYAEVTDYLRSVNFETGEACVSFTDRDNNRWLRRSFASRADGVIVSETRCDRPFSADVLLGLRPEEKEPWDPGHTSSGYVPKGAFLAHGLRSVEKSSGDDFLTLRAAYAKSAGGYEGVAKVSTPTGAVHGRGAGAKVTEAESLLVISTASPVADFSKNGIDALCRKIDTSGTDYDALLSAHTEIHSDLYHRVQLNLGSEQTGTGGGAPVPVEDLIAGSRKNGPSPEYIQTVFNACRYNIICSSGELPPNLQGIWTGTWTPHWSGDYTLDANVQAAIAHYFSCGTPELMKSLFELMDRMLPEFRETAQALFGARGIFVNSRVSTTGRQQRYNMCPMYFWTAGGAWLAHYYFDYYQYTGDIDFLRSRALPFMEEAALFFEDFLVAGDDGYLEFIPSVSPENEPANSNSLVTVNATMDIAAVRELLSNLIKACETLEIKEKEVDAWKAMLDKLPPYMANEDGALKEWLTPVLEDNYEHRHMSHLYPLYPGDEADRDGTPELHDMVLKAFHKRMEHYNPDEYGGFGLYHVSMAAARAGDHQTAWNAVKHMAQWHMYTGMGTSHNHGPTIFNMDASGGVPAAIVEMLVVSRPGRIRLLPALPDELGSGEITGVLCRGGITVERLKWNVGDGTASVVLCSQKDGQVVVSVPDSGRAVSFEVERQNVATPPTGGAVELLLKAGQSTALQIAWQ